MEAGKVKDHRPWLLIGFVLGALLLSSCGSDAVEITRAFIPTSTPFAAPINSPTSLPEPPRSSAGPSRWGYNPAEATGRRDRPVEFKPLPPGYRIETFVTGLQRPTAIAFMPGGRLLVAEQGGALRLVVNGRLQRRPMHTFDVFMPESESGFSELGLVGLAVDPNFERNGYVYAYYHTAQPERRTVLERLRIEDGRATDSEEILSIEAAPKCCHIAGSLRFAPDGTLFVTVGDHQLEQEAQNRGSPFGSILRIDRDGRAPPDNPFVNDESADPRVYAYGLRNPYDVAIDPVTGVIFATENGHIGQDAVIKVRPGANYGWPGSGLAVPLGKIEPPLLFYHEATGPAGIDFYRDGALPAFNGTLLFCQFHRGGALHVVTFHLNGKVNRDSVIASGCTSDVLTGPDGLIYFVDYVGGVVYRIAAEPAMR